MKTTAMALGLAAGLAFVISPIAASAAGPLTVAEIFAQQQQLAGQRVQLRGEVVKVNNNIMGKNFLHIQDGTGGEGTNDLTVTSQQTARVGEQVDVDALLTLNRDFGMGYSYPVILEEARITPVE